MAISRSQIKKQLLELGGRIGLQEGGGIEQRLEQLGGDVTSAEQMLQGINQRLKTAESSLGSGGGIGGLPSIGGLAEIANNLDTFPGNPNRPTSPNFDTAFGGAFKGLDMSGFKPVMSAQQDVMPFSINGKEIGGMNSAFVGSLKNYLDSTGQGDAFSTPGFTPLGGTPLPANVGVFQTGQPIQMSAQQALENQGKIPNLEDLYPNVGQNQINFFRPENSTLRSGIPAIGFADGGIANRQKYGLGSFVKKITRKVTKPVTKVAQKIVPKEVAGIMRVAAPFLPPGYREAAYLLGTAKQTGRISPVDLALVSLPYANKALGSQKNLPLMERQGFFAEQFPKANEFLFGAEGFTDTPVNRLGMVETASRPATTGILGTGGKMFQFGKGAGPAAFRDQTKLGSFLLEGDPGKFSMSKLAGLGIGTLSLIQNAKTPEEAGTALAEATGNSDDYERGKELFAKLPQGIFDIPEQFRLQSKDGGLMRENYALGTMPTAQESGLGGLPIEADMRYTGGFMPYGAKEKADDVPARLSKNEFVFTADAVRAAGGGSVNEGAKKMYQAMKQLEAKPEAKGMMA